ncbi:CDP-archaeol synthase [Bermanella sp. WJH001]|uniref:CDP-archaeol synthase n=1 Tax=Bermanella sp. WJH001 TaxID=3048005 RepID=UPI0024BDD8C3|nr:CDP-archaeol synthase [Bermanella sp. WJH001]MDJ1537587.1 CDP-archaeol synthase [Bermanella sp. WJH001]
MLKQRILTALVLAPIMIGGIFYLPLAQFKLFIGVIVALGAWEWANLSGLKLQVGRIAYAGLVAGLICAVEFSSLVQEVDILYIALGWWITAFVFVSLHPKLKNIWSSPVARLIMGLFILLPMWVGFVQIKSYPFNDYLIMYVMFIVWGADVGAYFAGRTFGKRKLAPSVSPGKTWEGVFGGLFVTTLMALGGGYLLENEAGLSLDLEQWALLIVLTLLITCFSVVGDLIESMVKRHRGIKDSSHLLPGHGGVMDRIDSMTAALPLFALALSVFGWNLVV